MQPLPDLNPGSEVQPANKSNQNDVDLKPVEEIVGHESDSDDGDTIGLEELMTKLQDAEMDVHERLALSQAISKAKKEGILRDFIDKSPNAIVKAHFKDQKAKEDDDSDFMIEEKLKKPKTTAKIKGIKSKRGRPFKVKNKSKVSLLVKALLEEQVPDAVLLIDHTFQCIKLN